MGKTEESSLIKNRSERKKKALDPGFVLLGKKKKA